MNNEGVQQLVDEKPKVEKKVIYLNPKDTDAILKALQPTFNSSFITIFGVVSSVKNVMLMLGHSKFDIRWLTKRLTRSDYAKINKENDYRYTPNYWEIIKLVYTDRLLADKPLIDKLINRYGGEIDNIKFVYMVNIRRGIISDTMQNDKLRKYGSIVTKVTTRIVKLFMSELETGKYKKVTDIDSKRYKELKNDIKKDIIEEAILYSDGRVLDTISDIDNESLKKTYLK